MATRTPVATMTSSWSIPASPRAPLQRRACLLARALGRCGGGLLSLFLSFFGSLFLSSFFLTRLLWIFLFLILFLYSYLFILFWGLLLLAWKCPPSNALFFLDALDLLTFISSFLF